MNTADIANAESAIEEKLCGDMPTDIHTTVMQLAAFARSGEAG